MIRKIAAASFAFVCAVALADGEFAPVAYRSAGETAFEVEVWGRTYRYENSVFPVSVRTAGRETTSRPGVYASAYRDGRRATIVVSNLSRTRRTAAVAVPAGSTGAVDLLTGERFPASGGKVEFPTEPFRPRILAMSVEAAETAL